jgi:hypothetical protein
MNPEGSLPHSQVSATWLYAEPGQSSPCSHPTSRRSILILSSLLHLGLTSVLFPSSFPTNTLYGPLPIHASCPAHLILLNLITQIILVEECKSLSSPLCSLFCFPVICPSLAQIFSSAPYSQTPSAPHSSLSLSDQVSHPYKTIDKIIVLYFVICMFLDRRLEDRRFCTEW